MSSDFAPLSKTATLAAVAAVVIGYIVTFATYSGSRLLDRLSMGGQKSVIELLYTIYYLHPRTKPNARTGVADVARSR